MNKSSSFCQKRDLIFEPECKVVLCGQQVKEGRTFCSVHRYADDLFVIVRMLSFPGAKINTCITVEAGEESWYEFILTLPDPFYRINHAVPRVMQTYLALVAYVEEYEVPVATKLLHDFYTKYVYQERHLHVVTKKVPAKLTKIPF